MIVFCCQLFTFLRILDEQEKKNKPKKTGRQQNAGKRGQEIEEVQGTPILRDSTERANILAQAQKPKPDAQPPPKRSNSHTSPVSPERCTR